jgi:hypothetical protein
MIKLQQFYHKIETHIILGLMEQSLEVEKIQNIFQLSKSAVAEGDMPNSNVTN